MEKKNWDVDRSFFLYTCIYFCLLIFRILFYLRRKFSLFVVYLFRKKNSNNTFFLAICLGVLRKSINIKILTIWYSKNNQASPLYSTCKVVFFLIFFAIWVFIFIIYSV